MIFGFTGTQFGMKPAQILALKKIILGVKPTEVHHGLCIGADAQFHASIRLWMKKDTRIVGHPCTIRGKQARWFYEDCDVLLPPTAPLERNKHIVIACDRLIAAPAQAQEQLRSGTWTTIRRAREQQKPTTIILPDGSLA